MATQLQTPMRTMLAPPTAPTTLATSAVPNAQATPAARVPPMGHLIPDAPTNDATGRLMERFLKIQPLTFAGISKDSLLPVKWVKEMEKAFDFLGCNEEQKISCVRYKLQQKAEAWWQITKPILATAHPVLTWEIFKEAFFGNYFPTSTRKKKEVQLMELIQGLKSVLEYQQKFKELFFFAPPHLNTDEAKALKFEDGLRPSLATVMITHKAQGYSEVVQLAKRIEDKQRDTYLTNLGSGKRSVPFADREYCKILKLVYHSSASSQPQRGATESLTPKPMYANPNIKAIEAPTNVASQEAKCYNCGQAGHYSRTCTNWRPSLPRRQQGNEPQGRGYSVSAGEAEASQTVVIAYTLFDTGATHSFVSSSFMKRMGITPKSLASGLALSTPIGLTIELDIVYEPCPIRIAAREMITHLIQLDMTDFDVILGMDWLAAYKPNVLCAKKKIVFQPRGEQGFIFVGDKKKQSTKTVISALQMKKLLSKGCQGYFISVMDTETKVRPMSKIPIVREFPDVFPDDLTSPPSARETEFIVDLLPGAAPVSKASYRMAPRELKELQAQLQDLLKKGFVKPSVSPWGATVLFVKKKGGSMCM
ncbi:uncharacterized protein LOC122668475 [Telopea speciosissima]|uniref:uncharacterized protein LOC122668475 n=1 Tax=Telopea speciosissima TaxID=54955 RepID=UPI001CC38C4E|nr:uncharacterized protein LOC122668475 [Telopea speciosissima]